MEPTTPIYISYVVNRSVIMQEFGIHRLLVFGHQFGSKPFRKLIFNQ